MNNNAYLTSINRATADFYLYSFTLHRCYVSSQPFVSTEVTVKNSTASAIVYIDISMYLDCELYSFALRPAQNSWCNDPLPYGHLTLNMLLSLVFLMLGMVMENKLRFFGRKCRI